MNNTLTDPLNSLANVLRPTRSPMAVERPGLSPDRQTLTVDGQNTPPTSPLAVENPIPAEQLKQAVSDISEYVQTVRRELQFSIDEALGRTVIKVLDGETQEVVRQIPAEEVLVLARHLNRLDDKRVEGLFVQARV